MVFGVVPWYGIYCTMVLPWYNIVQYTIPWYNIPYDGTIPKTMVKMVLLQLILEWRTVPWYNCIVVNFTTDF